MDTYTISQATAQQTVYAYTYDNLGNITSVKKNGTTVSNYEYDKLGRLIREDDCASNVCWVYAYDKAGNLLNKYEFPSAGPNVAHWMGAYPYVGEIVSTYGYSTSGWKDLLTNYNGTTITYDQIGNPLNWRNASSLTWDKRALQSMTLSNGTTLSFEYNADGIRNKKIYGGTVHVYTLDGATILKETIGASSGLTTLYYYYDESGISGVSYNGTKYSYVRNLQGDVIAILNSNGGTVVEYKYDAWGNVLSVTGSMANTLGAVNPFRYRGYYYDTETGLYYLNSRYYDPVVGRFINADGIIGANGGIMGYNMFAYCSNNPVCFADSAGNRAYCVATPDSNNQLTKMASCSSRGGGGGSSGTQTYNTNDTIITRQEDFENQYLGSYSVAKTGCEAIALHNAKIMLGMDSTLTQTLIDIMDNTSLICDGKFGLIPPQIQHMLDCYQIEYDELSLNEIDQEGLYIVTYWRDPYTNGIHTVMVTYDGNTYTSYNKTWDGTGIVQGAALSYISPNGWIELSDMLNSWSKATVFAPVAYILLYPRAFYLGPISQ